MRRPADCGDFSCLQNCSLCSPFFSYSFSRVSAKPMIKNSNSTNTWQIDMIEVVILHKPT